MNEFGVAMKLGIKFSSALATFHRYKDAGLIRWDSEQQRWVLTELGKRYLEECRKRGVG
jgi:Mn-dependent DtxR family transcriptional regulator